jgi:hypothetical protein
VATAADYSARVWKGDQTTVKEARDAYLNDPKKGLIPYAVALYSFRQQKKFAEELIGIRYQLISYAESNMLNHYSTKHMDVCVELAQQADILSTHLEWISRQEHSPLLFQPEQREYVWANASRLFYFGIKKAEDAKMEDHTLPLLYLTGARLFLTSGKFRSVPRAIEFLEEAEDKMALGKIPDPNQRARVYRKLGFLFRQCGETEAGLFWGVKALLIPGATMNTRAKSLAAFFGVDR